MADYVAVSEAVRLAEKKTTLLREVMKMRAESASQADTSKNTKPSTDQPKGSSQKT